MRAFVFGVALLVSTTAAAQGLPKLEIQTKQGNYYWVVETASDGTRRGGWVGVNVPLDAIDRSALKPLPSEQALAASEAQAPPPPSVDERLARSEQAIALGQGRTPSSVQSSELRTQTREGFWFNVGLGYGSAGCLDCTEREGGFSGGLSAGASINPRVLLGVGTSTWYKSEDGVAVSAGTFDARMRFYPLIRSGFFLTGGLGLGYVSVSDSQFGRETESGVGALFGLGWDIRLGRNVSLTPFYNGFAVQNTNGDLNVGQVGIGITIH